MGRGKDCWLVYSVYVECHSMGSTVHVCLYSISQPIPDIKKRVSV